MAKISGKNGKIFFYNDNGDKIDITLDVLSSFSMELGDFNVEKEEERWTASVTGRFNVDEGAFKRVIDNIWWPYLPYTPFSRN